MDPFKPFEIFADYLVYNLLNLQTSSKLAESIHFFIYDTLKIYALILAISFSVGLLSSYITPERIRKSLSGHKSGIGNVIAALIGIVTPFCSCSAVPFFLGFAQAGVPLGVTFSYLISAPMTNEVAFVLLWGFFGFKPALLYIVCGVIIAIVSGIIIGALKLEKHVKMFEPEPENCSCKCSNTKTDFKSRIIKAKNEAFSVLKKTYLYILIGVGIGAGIHNYIPTELLLKYAGSGNLLAVPIAVILGIPIYAGCAGALPIAAALIKAGMPMGTVLAFTMAVTALSLPEILILKKVMETRLLIIFVSVVTAAIIFTGYLFNFIL